MELNTGQIVTLATGEVAEILGIDSDPTCDVLVSMVENPDESRYIARSEIVLNQG